MASFDFPRESSARKSAQNGKSRASLRWKTRRAEAQSSHAINVGEFGQVGRRTGLTAPQVRRRRDGMQDFNEFWSAVVRRCPTFIPPPQPSDPEDNIADVSRRLSFSPLANHEPSSPQADIPIIVPSPPHRKLSQPVIDSIDEWLPNQPSASPTPISPFAPSTLLSAGFKALSPTKPRSYTHALKKSPTVKPRARTDRVRTLQPVVRDDSPPATKRTPKPRSAQANNKKKKRAAPEPANLTVLFDPASPESSPTQGARGRRERASKKKTRRESLGTVETPNNGDEDGPVESKPPKAKAQRKGRAPNAGLFTPTAMPLRSRSHKSKVKVVIQSQLELTPVTPTAAVSTLSTLGSPDTVRRSARKRFAPLEFWKNERPVYETDEDGLRNTVGLLIRK